MDSCGVMLFHFFLVRQRLGGRYHLFREGQNLKELAIKGDQIFFDQSVSCQDVIIDSNPQKIADPVIAIKGAWF